ncbi:MAG: hypothetical protein K0S09_2427 [Sphingobacteriaceae bacterium]|jgi:hypothetical protein|nr:hypothetical protein [Sphingobacteriaceae bacterium]
MSNIYKTLVLILVIVSFSLFYAQWLNIILSIGFGFFTGTVLLGALVGIFPTLALEQVPENPVKELNEKSLSQEEEDLAVVISYCDSLQGLSRLSDSDDLPYSPERIKLACKRLKAGEMPKNIYSALVMAETYLKIYEKDHRRM